MPYLFQCQQSLTRVSNVACSSAEKAFIAFILSSVTFLGGLAHLFLIHNIFQDLIKLITVFQISVIMVHISKGSILKMKMKFPTVVIYSSLITKYYQHLLYHSNQEFFM